MTFTASETPRRALVSHIRGGSLAVSTIGGRMDGVVHTDDFPLEERFDRWRNLVSQAINPVALITEKPLHFGGEMRSVKLDGNLVSRVLCSPCVTERSARLVRRSDPELVHLVLVQRGHAGVTQRSDAMVKPGELVIYNSWRPYTVHAVADGPESVGGIFAVIPYMRLPLARNAVERLTATAFPAVGIGALLASMITGLTSGHTTYFTGDTVRLGAVLADLVTAWLAHTLDSFDTLSHDTRQRVTLAQAQAFIHRNLANPQLTPSTIATAQHVSLRTLQRLFSDQGHTVAGYIRDLRLEHCRRDLADPRLRKRPVHAIAARWGFTHLEHFSRAFRAAYGTSPGDYRNQTNDRNNQ